MNKLLEQEHEIGRLRLARGEQAMAQQDTEGKSRAEMSAKDTEVLRLSLENEEQRRVLKQMEEKLAAKDEQIKRFRVMAFGVEVQPRP